MKPHPVPDPASDLPTGQMPQTPQSPGKFAAPEGSDGAEAQESKGEAGVFSGPTPGVMQRTVAGVLGEIVWLMSHSQAHKNFLISDLVDPSDGAHKRPARR